MTISLFVSGGSYSTVDLGVPGQSSQVDFQPALDVSGGIALSPFYTWSNGASGTINNEVLQVTVPIDFTQTYIVDASLSTDALSSSNIDLSHTATLGIKLPDGITYSSPLTFAGPESSAIPEPSSILGIASGLLALIRLRHGPRAATTSALYWSCAMSLFNCVTASSSSLKARVVLPDLNALSQSSSLPRIMCLSWKAISEFSIIQIPIRSNFADTTIRMTRSSALAVRA
jgi:hypothetical protein